ncbi:peptidase M23B [Calothrix sp. NIES-4071]|nr:peptidase M23B [Calothrix sp. NIES-4071]BAZ58108.1 peptidase M23B [Calothrix sp. NIES-4105]
MTQRKNARNSKALWYRSLGAQSLCWLSSISLMSSGFVLAQTESAIDNIVPTTENTQSSRDSAPNITIERNTTPSKQSSNQNEFSSRRARLRERLKRNVQAQSENSPRIRTSNQTSEAIQRLRQARKKNQNESAQEIPPIRKLRPKIAESTRIETPSVRIRRSIEATSQPRESKREQNTQVPDKLPEVSQNSQPVNTTDTDKPVKDYNNAYIDPTDYSGGNTAKYESPNAVILTERSSGCRAILAAGGVRADCFKTPITASLRRRLTASNGDNDNNTARASKPSWIRKSQNISVASAVNVRRPAITSTTNSTNTDKTSGQASWRTRIAATNRSTSDVDNQNTVNVTRSIPRAPLSIATASSNKNTYHPNRFIPSPSNFASSPIPLGTSTTDGVALPPPVNAVNVAPRDSRVAYNIPLESTLPRVAYSGPTIAYNPNGLIFPLSIPASITSIFGWRNHPITGETRFHSGTDLGAAMGTPVIAAFTGQVEVADFIGGYGLTAVLNHNGAVQTLYGHMSQLYVQPGQWVQQGTVIGLVGSTGNSTGPHLHFEVRQLTPEGWVAIDPGVHLQYALSQLMQSIQTAQVPQNRQ